MSPSCHTSHLDLAQTMLSGKDVRHAMKELSQHFSFEVPVEGSGWSKVNAEPAGLEALLKVRTSFFKAEFTPSGEVALTPFINICANLRQFSRIAKAIIPEPEEGFILAKKEHFLEIRCGETQFPDTMVDKRDGIVLITASVSGSPEVTIKEPEDSHGIQRTTTLTFATDSIHMVAARCTISVPKDTVITCVMLYVWRGSI